MSRSLKKKPFVHESLLKKLKTADKKNAIRTWSRDSMIIPEMVGYIFGVHNGKEHVLVKISEEMVGHRLGEFSPTRKFKKHGGRMAREQEKEALDQSSPIKEETEDK